MKKLWLFLILNFALTIISSKPVVKIVKEISAEEYATQEKTKIYIVDIGAKRGVLIGRVFILTDKATFEETFLKNRKNYEWRIWVESLDEFVMVEQTIFILSCENGKDGYIDIVVTTFSRFFSPYNNMIFTIKKKDIEALL